MKRTALFSLLMMLCASACGSGGKKPPSANAGLGGGAPIADQGTSLLKKARLDREQKGCEAAIPTYRVVASFGKGHDVAQYELGGCLLRIKTQNAAEARLNQDEALLWLRRAAWTGNSRAQRTLAIALSGAPGTEYSVETTEPSEAYGWMLIYAANSDHDLYNLTSIPPAVEAHLTAGVDALISAQGTKFANSFSPIEMASFSPPGRPQGEANAKRRPDFGNGGPRRADQ